MKKLNKLNNLFNTLLYCVCYHFYLEECIIPSHIKNAMFIFIFHFVSLRHKVKLMLLFLVTAEY